MPHRWSVHSRDRSVLPPPCGRGRARRGIRCISADDVWEAGRPASLEVCGMTLVPGTRLGPYEVSALIGVGGMGEVYRARDTKLGRDVAIKVLPASFVRDPDRLARFEREARTLAALNHPSIAAIHGYEEEGDLRGLILELVEGPTLAQKLERGPLAVRDAIVTASEMAEALDAAHQHGIVHRDPKPANVKLTANGRV